MLTFIHFLRSICLPAMMSACIFKDTLRNNTQVFLLLDSPFFFFVYISSILTFSVNYLNLSTVIFNGETSIIVPLDGSEFFSWQYSVTSASQLPRISPTTSSSILSSVAKINSKTLIFHFINMFRPITPDSGNSGVFYVERASREQSRP